MWKRSRRCSIFRPMVNSRHSVFIVVLLICLARGLPGQTVLSEDPVVEKRFRYALDLFEHGACAQASTRFAELAFHHGMHHRASAAAYMAARAALCDKATQRALKLVDSLFQRFPTSSYLAEAALVAARAASMQADTVQTALWLLRACALCDTLCAVTTEELRSCCADMSRASREQVLLHALALHIPLELLRAQGILPSSNERPMPRRPYTLAVLLPLQSTDARVRDVAEDMLNGMRAAVALRDEAASEVSLLVRDNGDRAAVREFLDRVVADSTHVAVLGGAFSDDARLVAEETVGRGVPCLIPAATDTGLCGIGEHVFQLNPPLLQRAVLLADYARLELDEQDVLILARNARAPRLMAEAFRERWLEQRGRASLLLWQDSLALRRGLRQMLAAKGEHGSKIRLLVAPAFSEDDIALLLEAAEAEMRQPFILGCGDWHHPALLLRHPQCTVLFESDMPGDADVALWEDARMAFSRYSQRSFSRHAMFGFDACRLAMRAADRCGAERGGMRQALTDVYEGMRAAVNFTLDRSNRALSLFRAEHGTIRRIESFHAK